MPKNMSLIGILLDTFRRLWRMANNRVTGRRLWRKTRYVGASDQPIDIEQAGEQARTAWFKLVRQRAPQLLVQGRRYPQPGGNTTWRLPPTPQTPAPSENLELLVAQAEAPRSAREGLWSWLPFRTVPGGRATALPPDQAETEGPSPRREAKLPLPPVQKSASAPRRLWQREDGPPFIQEASTPPQKPTDLDITARRQPPKHYESICTPHKPSPATESDSELAVRLSEQGLPAASGYPTASTNVRKQPFPGVARCDIEASRGLQTSADPLPAQQRSRLEPVEPHPAPEAQKIRSNVETDWYQTWVSVPNPPSAPLCIPTEDSGQNGESLVESAPLSSPQEQWPSLLPGRQAGTVMAPSCLWRDDERRRRLLNEQRGV